MSIEIATLMCHAPIVVPAVGGDRGGACAVTTAAMREVARRLVEVRPDVLIVLSPHTPRARRAWGLVGGEVLVGDFADFRAPGARFRLPAATDAARRLSALAPGLGVGLTALPARPLDHGAAVPLWFCCESGWSGPTAVLALPWEQGGEGAVGDLLRVASQGQRWAVLAAGDMSHRLTPGAPSGFHPRAAAFDAAFVERLRAGDLRGAVQVDPELRELAAEDVVTTVAVAAAAVEHSALGSEVLAYEGPFGVGYCEAVLHRRAS